MREAEIITACCGFNMYAVCIFKTIINKRGQGTLKRSQISVLLAGKMSTQEAGQSHAGIMQFLH